MWCVCLAETSALNFSLITGLEKVTNDTFKIERLTEHDAEAIVACFTEVYGKSYANDLFYSAPAIVAAMQAGELRSVGAWHKGKLAAHMAMSVKDAHATSAELGNTVVAPAARGAGLAWQVGTELTAWTIELGYVGYLHYPTTDHHIMQRQSVKNGFETGLMLGYIPAETDGQASRRNQALRGSATIVYNPLAVQTDSVETYLPDAYANWIERFADTCGLPRAFHSPPAPEASETFASIAHFDKRGLSRLTVRTVGDDIAEPVAAFAGHSAPCLQIDLLLDSPGVDQAVQAAAAQGFIFCGWLPGFTHTDVLRLQKVDPALTDMNPGVVNPTAQELLHNLVAP